jgi:hypothetical protein
LLFIPTSKFFVYLWRVSLKKTHMKKSLSLVIFLFFLTVSSAQNIAVLAVVDERTELLSAVFRMAGAEEYVNNTLFTYTHVLDSFLLKFKEDSLIRFARKIRKSNGIAYDAIMSYAVHLEISDSIRFIKDYIPGQIDQRWNPNIESGFLILLNDFYRKSNFHSFYQSHNSYYKEVENRFQDVLKEVDYQWFTHFFGVKSDGSFSVIISLLNRGNYGPSIQFLDGSKQVYSINGVYRTDSLGYPNFGKGLEPVIIHEFTHSFTNHLVKKYLKQLLPKGKKFYKPVQSLMKQQAYGTPETMLYEMMVRACVIQYYKDKDSSKVQQYLNNEMSKGFLWIKDLYLLINDYEMNRSQYPTLESFMPKIVKLQKSLNPKKMNRAYSKLCGHFLEISIPDGSDEVPYDTVRLLVTFAQPMNTCCYGISHGKKGEQYFPHFIKELIWDPETKSKFTATMVLEPDKSYSLCFPGEFFLTQNGFPVQGILYLDFNTIQKK